MLVIFLSILHCPMTRSDALPADSTANGTTSTTPVCVENAVFRTTNLWNMVVQLALVIDLSVHQVIRINLMVL